MPGGVTGTPQPQAQVSSKHACQSPRPTCASEESFLDTVLAGLRLCPTRRRPDLLRLVLFGTLHLPFSNWFLVLQSSEPHPDQVSTRQTRAIRIRTIHHPGATELGRP